MKRWAAISTAGAIAVAIAALGTAALGSLIIVAATLMLPSATGTGPALLLSALVLTIFAIVFLIVFRDMHEKFTR